MPAIASGTTAIRRAIYAKLRDDASGSSSLVGGLIAPSEAPGYTYSIYYGIVPDEAAYPYVLFNKQSGVPTSLGFGDYRLAQPLNPYPLDTDIWLVKGVARAPSADTAEAIAGRLSYLLNDGVLSVADATLPSAVPREVVYLRRESDVDYAEVIEGVQYRHSGALYRLIWTTVPPAP